MFGKLLKYDLKSELRVWLVSAMTTLLLSGILGICIRNFENAPKNNGELFLFIMTVFFMVAIILIISVFFLITSLMPIIRFYTHLYTDEGYLTFTLPVTTTQIVWSKILNEVIWYVANGVLLIAGIGIATFTSGNPEMFGQILNQFGDVFRELWQAFIGTANGAIYVILATLISITSVAFAVMQPFVCITIGAVVAKKNKLLAGIGVYVAMNIILNIAVQAIGSLFMILLAGTGTENINIPIYLTMGAIIVFYGGAAVGSYFLNHHLMNKKLNLA